MPDRNPWAAPRGLSAAADAVVLGGAAAALAGLGLAALVGAPYWDGTVPGAGMLVFVAGLFAALCAVPFAARRRQRARRPQRSGLGWELPLAVWFGASVAVAVAGFALIAIAGGGGDSLGGSAGGVMLAEGLLFAGTVILFAFFGG